MGVTPCDFAEKFADIEQSRIEKKHMATERRCVITSIYYPYKNYDR